MALTGDVELKQNGIVVSARDLTATSKPLDVAINDSLGNQLSGFDPSKPSTAVLSQPVVTTASSVILAADPTRKKFTVYNAGNKQVFLAFAATASSVAFSIPLAIGGFYESEINDYTGVVSAIASTGSQTLQVTSLS